MSPVLVASLSIVPGAGHLAVGRGRKAAVLFAIDLGLIGATLFVKSTAGHLLIGLSYCMVAVPAVIESYTLARGGAASFTESRPYIVILLLATGFAALPLLWESHAFSKRIKILWSIAVPVLAIIYFFLLGLFGLRFLNR